MFCVAFDTTMNVKCDKNYQVRPGSGLLLHNSLTAHL